MKDEPSLKITTSLLVSYAYGLLAPQIAVQVKKALEEDELLRLQYQGIIQLIKDYPDHDPEELLEQMAARVQQKIKISQRLQTNAKPMRASRRWLLIAAAIIIIAGTFVAIENGNHTAKQLASSMLKNASITPYSSATRGNISPNDSTSAWKEAFVQNNFNNVITALETKAHLTSEEQFFLAIAYLKQPTPQPGKAGPLLKQLIAANNEYTPDAWLYLGLAQTLEDKKQEAVKSLSRVEQTDQVKDLIERLRR